MTKNWQNIHYAFTKELEQQWTNHGFSYWQVKEWIDIGLTPDDANFVAWLEQEGYTALAVLNYEDLQILREKYQQSLTNPQPNFPQPKPKKLWWKLLIVAILVIVAYYLLTN